MKQLISVIGGGDYCTLVHRADDTYSNSNDKMNHTLSDTSQKINNNHYILVLCNSIGTPLESKYIEIEPLFSSMTASHVVIASKSHFYVWNYQVLVDYTSIKKQINER